MPRNNTTIQLRLPQHRPNSQPTCFNTPLKHINRTRRDTHHTLQDLRGPRKGTRQRDVLRLGRSAQRFLIYRTEELLYAGGAYVGFE
jgi:hypothetical protein